MKILFRRPFLLFFAAFAVLVYCIVEYNVLLPMVFGFTAIGVDNALEGAMSFIQLMLGFFASSGMMPSALLYFLGILFVASAAAGFLLSGYFSVLNNALEGKPREKGGFFLGVRKHFLKLFLVTLRVLPLSLLFTVFMMIVCVPAIVLTRWAAMGKPEFLIGAVFVGIVTVCVLFFGFMFFRIYMLFWYPSAMSAGKKAFVAAKHIADKHFWEIAGKFLMFDMVFIVFQGIFLGGKLYFMRQESADYALATLLLAADWLFKTVFFGSFVVYIFSAFKSYAGGNIK